MTRKQAILILVALAALLAATPALAASPGEGQGQGYWEGGYQSARPARRSFSLVGIITEVGTRSITIEVYQGNRVGQAYIGDEVTVLVTRNTRYRQWAEDGCTPITFGDVSVGQTASVQGTLSGTTFTARRVTVDVACCTQ